MEVGQGPNWGCSATRKKEIIYHVCANYVELCKENRSVFRNVSLYVEKIQPELKETVTTR
jgi:hypothetical protein